MNTSVVSVCEHCGLPVSAPHRHAEDSLYCCYGCEVAAHLLGKGDEAGARLSMYKLAAGVILGINVMMFSMPLYVESLGAFFRQGLGSEAYFELLKWLLMALSLPVYFLLGMPFIESAIRNIRDGLRSNADLLIAIGVTAAMLVSMFDTIFTNGPVYYETAVAILVIVTGGRYLEAKARAKASRAVDDLEKTVPSIVTVVASDGSLRDVQVSSLKVGDVILSKPGEQIPVDCVIKSGSAEISEAMLSGEPHPVRRGEGELLLAGAINYDGLLHLGVLRVEAESYIMRLKSLLIESKQGRAEIQDTADRIAATAIPIIIAVAIASLIYWSGAVDLRHGLFAFLGVVLVACPCAIGIATPAALWVAVTEASRHGILFRSLGVVERLSSVKNLFFDKTGTLTVGKPAVRTYTVVGDATAIGSDELLPLVGAVASLSAHPLSRAIADAYATDRSLASNVRNMQEVPAKGIAASIGTHTVRIGSETFVRGEHHISDGARLETTVWCSVRDEAGLDNLFEFSFADEVKPETKRVFDELHSAGYRTTILSGDEQSVATRMGSDLGSEALGKLTPKQKAEIVANEPESAFVGDGFNDAGAIGAARVGIAMGSGSDLVRSEADVILFDNDLERVPQLLRLSASTMRIVKQNLFWAFIYNVIGVFLAAFGLLNPIIAALAMALSSLAVAQNSMRLRHLPHFQSEGANA
ncbi:MAG: cadmium-translocating P-type ATPase [Bacteroidetes bacterium]|nr:cadmium-translocating P-type ATPase [Bacteroidota bacterium]